MYVHTQNVDKYVYSSFRMLLFNRSSWHICKVLFLRYCNGRSGCTECSNKCVWVECKWYLPECAEIGLKWWVRTILNWVSWNDEFLEMMSSNGFRTEFLEMMSFLMSLSDFKLSFLKWWVSRNDEFERISNWVSRNDEFLDEFERFQTEFLEMMSF